MTEPCPREGYKLVFPNWGSVHGLDVFRVGSTHALDDGVKPVLCQRGFHFCSRPVDCLFYFPYSPSCRLLRVVVPPEAVVVGADGNFAASALTVVEELPTTTGLLTGSGTFLNDDDGTIIVATYVDGLLDSRGNGDAPSWTVTDPRTGRVLYQQWHCEGLPYRDDGNAATIVYYPQGTVKTRTWAPRRDGVFHHTGYQLDGSLRLAIVRDGDVDIKTTYHRDGSVAKTECYRVGGGLISRNVDDPPHTPSS
jgi:hypothetical protein